MHKTERAIGALRILLVLLFVALVAVQTVVLPGAFSELAEEQTDLASLRWPLLVASIFELLLAEVVIVCTWKLLRMVQDDRIFTEGSMAWVDAILWTLVGAWVVLFGAFLLVLPRADYPGVPVLMMMLLLAGAGFGLVLLVMRALLRQATELRTDMEAVI